MLPVPPLIINGTLVNTTGLFYNLTALGEYATYNIHSNRIQHQFTNLTQLTKSFVCCCNKDTHTNSKLQPHSLLTCARNKLFVTTMQHIFLFVYHHVRFLVLLFVIIHIQVLKMTLSFFFLIQHTSLLIDTLPMMLFLLAVSSNIFLELKMA